MRLDPQLEEFAQRAVLIHESLHNNGGYGMTAEEFKDLYYRNLNNYIAILAHAQFDSGLPHAVIIIKDVLPLRQEEIKQLLNHNLGGLRFSRKYADDIAQHKRQVHIWIQYIDGGWTQAIYGVKDLAAKAS